MFEKIKGLIQQKAQIITERRKPGRPPLTEKKSPIEAITKELLPVEVIVKERIPVKKICHIEAHNCIAIQLTNRLICMIEEFEKNIDRIENHPTLSETTKLDIQNYINKNIISAIWALSPAFDLMKDHNRLHTFKIVYTKTFAKGAPGVLDEIKHI